MQRSECSGWLGPAGAPRPVGFIRNAFKRKNLNPMRRRSDLRSARLPVNLIGSPVNYANRLIGSPITSQALRRRLAQPVLPGRLQTIYTIYPIPCTMCRRRLAQPLLPGRLQPGEDHPLLLPGHQRVQLAAVHPRAERLGCAYTLKHKP